jgi:lipopolysaccharide assembly protein A
VRVLTWAARLAVFLLLVALAAKNVEPVTLRFYFDQALRAPLVLILLGAFALGALSGVLAMLGTVLRQRREISALKRPGADVPPNVLPPPI